MSRTLGPIQQPHADDQNSEQNDEPFYLKNQLPMFLAHNEGQTSTYKNLDEDIVVCKQLIESLCDNQIKTRESLQEIAQLLGQQEDLSKGMGYFSAKNLIFLEYLMLLKLYELFKLSGKSLTTGNGLDLYKRLAYLKTLLLKLQPVEKKLEYQKNKMLKHSDKAIITKQNKKEESEEQQQASQEAKQDNKIEEEQQEENEQNANEEDQQQDEMAFKPRPSALMKIKHEKDVKLVKNDKYEAPKVSSNLSKEDKLKQRMQRQKQIKKIGLIRRLQSDLIQDDRAEERFLGDEINEKFKRKFQQKLSYEEDAFIRLPDSKKDKFYMKQMVRNSARKNQLEEDLKEVQMVRQLFDDQNQMQGKILNEKRKKEFQNKKQSSSSSNHEKKGKTKPINKKFNKK